MTMNWGTKIAVIFGVFVAGILFMVLKSSQQNIDLVTPDYYEQELKYQDVIEASRRTAALGKTITFSLKDDMIDIVFPEEMRGQEIKGMVWLYCMADQQKDLKRDFTTSSGLFHMPYNAFNKGNYALKVSWQAAGLTYYHEQKLIIQ